VRLLFDQNLSPKLALRLADLFPGSDHLDRLGLGAAPDKEIWDYALRNGFAVVTKDEDYSQLSVLLGCPPKVLWILLGNCTTSQVEALLRHHRSDIFAFESDASSGVLALG